MHEVEERSKLLESPVRSEIVAALRRRQALGGMTAAELADRVALHVTTVRFHLDRLVQAGLVTSATAPCGVGRPRRRYALPTKGAPAGGPHALLAGVLVEAAAGALDGAPVGPREAGARWARDHATAEGLADDGPATTPRRVRTKVGRVLGVLDAWGYAPAATLDDDGCGATLRLADCPFRSLAAAHPEVVCAIHHGLLRGALDAIGERDAALRLRPFVEPRLCCAHVRVRSVPCAEGAPV